MKFDRLCQLPLNVLTMVGLSCGSFNFAVAETLYHCVPIYPTFCKNIHIGCTGRTHRTSPGFVITGDHSEATIVFDNGQQTPANILSSGEEQLIRVPGSREWIRIEKNGRFSRRVYHRGGALMALGRCSMK